MNTPRVTCLFFAVALGAGCETARDSRIRKNDELFASLDPFSQKLVREGLFNVGFTADTVVMAMGKPDQVEKREAADGPIEIWTYKNFLYSSMNHMTIAVRDPSTMRSPQRPGQRGSPGMTAQQPGQPTVAEMGGPPLATLHIELHEHRVTRAVIDL